jgi:acetyl-CoA carboxylase biotin carboxylase subunit
MGHKTQARQLMRQHGLPMCPSTEVLDGDTQATLTQAHRLGYPVMVKPANGGGGIGMVPVQDEMGLLKSIDKARALAQRSFGDSQVYLEKLLTQARHVEVQVLGDQYGMVRHVFGRDCSVQRRHQKVIEEAPAPALLAPLAQQVADTLADLGYDNIGTMEFLFQAEVGFSFLEMNTRLQVEHGVTEAITGLDLVAAQIRLAAGEHLADVLPPALSVQGHAIEARLYAEDARTFFPSPGPLEVFRPPVSPGIRIETGYREGDVITPYYDPLLAKVIAHAPRRDQAIRRLLEAVQAFEIRGVKTNQAFIARVLQHEAFCAGEVHTSLAQQLARK